MQHLDEGTIHAWLDDQLPPAQAEEARRHVESCAACGALVAEARGFIAASSRILSALDGVPGGLLPARSDPADGVSPPHELGRRRAAKAGGGASRRNWYRHPGIAAAAAVVVVAVGSFTVLTRVPRATAITDKRSASMERAPALDSNRRVAPAPATGGAAPMSGLPAVAPAEAAHRDAASTSRSLARAADAPRDTEPPQRRPPDGLQPVAVSGTSAQLTAVGRDSLSAKAVAAAATDSAKAAGSRTLAMQEVVVTGAATPVPTPRPSTPERGARERTDNEQRAALARQPLGAGATARDETRSVVAAKAESARVAPGCYALQAEGVGNMPTVGGVQRFPTHIQLDTTVVPQEAGQPLFSARDLNGTDARATSALRWRVAAGGFDLFIQRGSATVRVPVLLESGRLAGEQRTLPQPAGAALLLRATREPCVNR